MARSFCVVRDRWIPVIVRSDLGSGEVAELERLMPGAVPGGRVVVGLHLLFEAAHLLADLDVPHPPVEAMLRRLLAAVTARVTGLDAGRSEEWLDRREDVLAAGRFDAAELRAYWGKHSGRWNLYDATRPYLQDPRLAAECREDGPPGRLAMNRPSGNNGVWTDNTPQAVPLDAAEAAGWLLVWYGFGPSGTAAVRSRNGRGSKTCKAGPYRSLISYFPHAPERLFVSLVASVPGPSAWPTSPGDDLAPWEGDLLAPTAPPAPSGPVSLLTARTAHAVLLTGDDVGRTTGCRVTWGTSVALPAAVDPYVIERDKGGPLLASRERAVWRDLDALLLKVRPGTRVSRRRPTVFDTLADLPPDTLRSLGVRAVAWDQERRDKNSRWYEATTPPLLGHMEENSPEGAAAIAAAHHQAEAAASALGRALSAAWHAVNTGRRSQERSGFLGRALTRYWEEAETEFWKVVTDTGERPAFRRITLSCFDTAAKPLKTTVHGMDAVAKARVGLTHPSGKK